LQDEDHYFHLSDSKIQFPLSLSSLN